MNVKEINNELNCFCIYNSDKIKIGKSINLIEYFELSQKIRLDGKNYVDYSYDCYGPAYCSPSAIDRVYYYPKDDIVIQSHSDLKYHKYSSYYIYNYDEAKNELVGRYGGKLRKQIDKETGKDLREEFLKYYQHCKKLLPYIKPIQIESDLFIDGDMNLYKYSQYEGDFENLICDWRDYKLPVIANLKDLIKYLLNPKNEDKKVAIELKNILSTLKINVDILPSLYRDYLKKEKSKQKSKTISH